MSNTELSLYNLNRLHVTRETERTLFRLYFLASPLTSVYVPQNQYKIMKKFKLYYTKLLVNGFFRTKWEFATHTKMIDFIDEQCINRKCIWLLYKRDCDDVFISGSHLSIQDFLQKKMTWKTIGDYFLEEYETYRDAYNKALEIIENE